MTDIREVNLHNAPAHPHDFDILGATRAQGDVNTSAAPFLTRSMGMQPLSTLLPVPPFTPVSSQAFDNKAEYEFTFSYRPEPTPGYRAAPTPFDGVSP